MISLTLHPMKEIKIVVQGEHLKFVTDLLDRVGATGYTIINNISGKGHHGFHEGHLLFNDTSSQVMVFTVVPEEKVEPILSGLGHLYNKHSGTITHRTNDFCCLRSDVFGLPKAAFIPSRTYG